ncbi:uncharacterized protein METZ01_LOCUS507641, partial [marine metagenome]
MRQAPYKALFVELAGHQSLQQSTKQGLKGKKETIQ